MDPRGQATRRTFFSLSLLPLAYPLPLVLLSPLLPRLPFVSTMDEIAPEYDVVVLGTGKLLAYPAIPARP